MKKLLNGIFKKIRAFSILEIVISFIIIGSVTSAFTPVVIKKMGNKSIKISDRIVAKTNCFGDCSLCNQDGKCWICNAKCGDGYYKDITTCTCKPCSDIGLNIAKCSVGKVVNQCKLGYYLEDNSCKACTKGYYCPDGKKRHECPVGTYSDVIDGVSCKSCNSGKYQDQTAQSYCKTTTPGHYTPAGGNWSSQENCYTKDAHYSYGNASSCSNCPIGQYAVDANGNWNGSSYLGVKCYGCSNLYYCTPGVFPILCSTQFNNCITCSSTENKCTKCKAGYYVDSNGKCKLCTKGYYCPDGINWRECPAGKYSDTDDASECKTCPAGKTSTAAATSCTNCNTANCNNYSSGCTCSDCNKGYVVSNGACVGCYTNQGKYSPGGTLTSCQTCPAGKYAMDDSLQWNGSFLGTQCGTCGADWYCNGAEVKKCSTKISNCAECNSSTAKCTKCNAGYYLDNGKCLVCTKGYYCPDGINWHGCTAGKYSDIDTASSCTNCPQGTYSAANASACTKCAAGTYASSVGSSSCTSCSAGKTSAAGASSCTDCNVANCSKYSSGCKCSKCNSGFYLSNNVCTKCSEGIPNCAECTAGSNTCTKCNDGYTLQDGRCDCPTWAMKITIDGKKKCMTKFNVGDSVNGVGENIMPVTEAGINMYRADVYDQNSHCQYEWQKCCWVGASFNNSSTKNDIGNYSGSGRIQCNYNAAAALCSKLNNSSGWRLPTQGEVNTALAIYTLTDPYIGAGGLQICGGLASAYTSSLIRCYDPYVTKTQCVTYNNHKGNTGATANYCLANPAYLGSRGCLNLSYEDIWCYPGSYWTSDPVPNPSILVGPGATSLLVTNKESKRNSDVIVKTEQSTRQYGRSVRCIYDIE